MTENDKSIDANEKPTKKHSYNISNAVYHAFRRMTQVTLVLIIITIIGVAVLWLRLQAGSIDLTFAQDKVENLISAQIEGYDVKFEKLSLVWLNIQDPFVMETQKVTILKGATPFTTIENLKIGLSSSNLLRAKVRPAFLQITNPKVQLLYQDDKISLCCINNQKVKNIDSVIATDTTNPSNVSKDQKNPIAVKNIRFLIQDIFSDIVNDTFTGPYKIFQNLSKIELENVSLELVQEGKPVRDLGNIDLQINEANDSVIGQISAQLNNAEETSLIETSIVYRALQKDLTFVGNVKDFSTNILDELLITNKAYTRQNLEFSGKVQAAFNEKFKLVSANVDLFIPEGEVFIGEGGGQKFDIKALDLNGYYNRNTKQLSIKNLSGDVNNIPFTISADGTRDKRNIFLPVNLKIPNVKMEKISALISDSMSDNAGLSWPKRKLTNGILKDIDASFDLRLNKNKETKTYTSDVKNIFGSLGFEDMNVQYSDTLKPAEKAQGVANFSNNNLVVTANSAQIDNITASKVVVDLKNLIGSVPGSAVIDIAAKGPLKTILNYISDKPIHIGSRLGFDIKNTQGNVTADVQIRFPITSDVKAKDFDVNVDGTLNNILIPNIVSGLPLSGGPYSLKYSGQKIDLNGSGKLANRDITVDWKQDLQADLINLKADIITDMGLRKAFGVDLDDYITGPVPINLSYTANKGRKIFNLAGNITNTAINIDAIDYTKEVGEQGNFSLKGLIESDEIKEIDALNIKAKDLLVNNGRIIFSQVNGNPSISQGAISNASINGNQLSANFEVTPTKQIKLVLNADYLDANPFFSGEKTTKVELAKIEEAQNRVQASEISLNVKKLVLKNDVTAENAKIYFSTNSSGKMSNFEMDANIGNGKTVLRYKPIADQGAKLELITLKLRTHL